MEKLLQEIRACQICKASLPHGCRPVLAASPSSRVLIIGQAPGRKVHETGVPWDDKSGDNLRDWLGVTKAEFYNEDLFALVPMGFCYPGTGKSGDLPPRPECAPTWHSPLLASIQQPQLTLLIGQYAQRHYLKLGAKANLTETVRNFTDFFPQYLPLPHPSPRNNIWMRKNPWFGAEVLPQLREKLAEILGKS